MSDEGQSPFEIPKEMRSMAEASFDQARKAFENFLSSAQQTASTIEGKGAEVRAGAKDITEVMRLHSEYVQNQMRSLAEQASEMGQIVSRAAMDAAKPKGS